MVESAPLDRCAAETDDIDWPSELLQQRGWLKAVIRGRLGEADLVDDVLQDVSSAVLRSDNRPARREQVAPWLYRIAVRRCLMQRRIAGRRRKLLAQLRSIEENESEAADPLAWLLGRERKAAVRQALERLNPIDRDVFILKHAENWTYRQLAERLGCSVHTIEHRLLRARQELRRVLAALGVTGAAS